VVEGGDEGPAQRARVHGLGPRLEEKGSKALLAAYAEGFASVLGSGSAAAPAQTWSFYEVGSKMWEWGSDVWSLGLVCEGYGDSREEAWAEAVRNGRVPQGRKGRDCRSWRPRNTRRVDDTVGNSIGSANVG